MSETQHSVCVRGRTVSPLDKHLFVMLIVYLTSTQLNTELMHIISDFLAFSEVLHNYIS